MRRVWAAVMSMWALLALVAVFAWSRPPLPVHPTPQAAVVRTVHGKRIVVVAPPAHATTQTSPGAQATVLTPSGSPAVVSPAGAGGNN